MTYECPFCPRKFSSPKKTLAHVESVHERVEKLTPGYRKIDRLKTQNFALKIKKLPKKIIIPKEYMGAFTAVE